MSEKIPFISAGTEDASVTFDCKKTSVSACRKERRTEYAVTEKNIRGICPLQRDKSVEEKLGLISARPNLNMGSAELDENGLLLYRNQP